MARASTVALITSEGDALSALYGAMGHDRRVRHPVEPGRSSPHSRQSLDRWQLTPQHRARSSWAVSEGSGQ